MNYHCQPDQTICTSVSYSDIYISSKCHAIRLWGYLVIASYMDFYSIQGL